MTDHKIGTLNTRGGGNKTEQIIRTLNKSGNTVTCLQETHEIPEKGKKEIEIRCKGTIYCNNGTTQSRGVAIFVQNKEGMRCRIISNDMKGRILGIEIKEHEISCIPLTIFNIYAPNEICQRHDFFCEVTKKLENAKGRIVVTGDFNCILDRFLDRTKSDSKGALKADKSKTALTTMMRTHSLVDTYRRLQPLGTAHTFTGPNGYRARLDRIYTDQDTAESVKRVTVQAVSYSDHDLVCADFGESEKREKWGYGRWHLNTKLLFDETVREELNECIHYCKKIKVIYPDILTWWDELKGKIKETLIRQGKRIQGEKRKEQKTLETELNILIAKSDVTKGDTDRIREIKHRLEEIEKEKEEGCRVRSKEEWIDKRENCGRFFYDEEKRKGKLKMMNCVLDEMGEAHTSKEDICKIVKGFYEKLLSREKLDEHEIGKLVGKYVEKKLSESERESIEGIISKQEVLKALKSMKNNKSPGLDGLPREFYVIMWDEIGNELCDVIANICLMDKIPESWTEGLVSIMFKEKGDVRDLKNWRPITLLNTDYKILTKAIANRMRKVANSLISEDQSCGLPNRSIHDQLYFIRDFTNYFNETNKRAVIISIDQEKCFDRIDHRVIHIMLEIYNFGTTIKSLIRTIYSDMKSRIMINGFITDSFTVTRSARQGDSMSMLIAVLVGELLGNMIRKNMEVSPICLPNSKPKKVAQYADDTSILTDNTKSICSLWRTLNKYEKITGAKVNEQKTEILLAGKWSKKQQMSIPEKYRPLIKETVKILGISFGKNAESENENKIKQKIESEIDKWKDRNLSMGGKIAILRTLVTSKVWHIAKVTGLRSTFIKWLNQTMTAFFWFPKKYHPISLKTLQNDYKNGGQNFPDVVAELKAYLMETVATAATHPQKQWVGMMRYRHGSLLKDILPKQKNCIYTRKQSATSAIVQETLEKMQGITTWEDMNYKKLLIMIRENIPTVGREDQWKNVRKSSRRFKRLDLNYMIAHQRLPLAEFLIKTGIAKNEKCSLCFQEIQTHKHLFYDCSMITDLKQQMIKDLQKGSKTGKIDLTYDLLIWHTPKLTPFSNEVISAYKTSIWQTRAALYNDRIKDTKSYLLQLYQQ